MRSSALFSCIALSLKFSFCSTFYESDLLIHQITEPVDHAEGPHWVEAEQALYFVDIAGFGVHRYEPYTAQHSFIKLSTQLI